MAMTIRTAATPEDREAAYRLRHQVFVVEQNVPVELEIDEHDETDAIHFLALEGETLIGCGRLVPYGDGILKIGRLAVDPAGRGRGIGRNLVRAMVEAARKEPGVAKVILDAQAHATGFYEREGFSQTGAPFDDAGILHIRMEVVL